MTISRCFRRGLRLRPGCGSDSWTARGRDGRRIPIHRAETISPVCGYLMPNHLDAALEFFDVDGTNLGFVRPQDGKTIGWEEAPGQPSTVGQDPARAIPNGFSAGIA